MAKTYYIDGYNIVHRSSLLRPIAAVDLEKARETLIDRVAQLCIGGGLHAYVVFDGRRADKSELAPHHRKVAGLHVVYTSSELTADAWIERRVYQHADRLDVAVVTNDRSVRDLCRNLGALTMEADNFLDTVRESRRDMEQVMERGARQKIEHLEDRLDEGSFKSLMDLRKKLK